MSSYRFSNSSIEVLTIEDLLKNEIQAEQWTDRTSELVLIDCLNLKEVKKLPKGIKRLYLINCPNLKKLITTG